MAEFWSDYTDFVLSSIEKKLGNKYKVPLKGLLSNPVKYAGTAAIQTTIRSLSQDVDSYIDSTIASMPEEKKAMTDQLLKIDATTKQLASTVSMQAKAHKIPMIKPVTIERDESKEEVIFVDSVNDPTLALIDRLCGSSTIVSDFSYTYDKATIGSWLFSGQKNYVLSVYVPDNDVMMLEASRSEIQDMLDAADVMTHGI